MLPEFYFLPFFSSPPSETFPNSYLGNPTLSHGWGLDLYFPEYPAVFIPLFLNFYLLVCIWEHISSSEDNSVQSVLASTLMRALGAELKLPGLQGKCLHSLSHLAGPPTLSRCLPLQASSPFSPVLGMGRVSLDTHCWRRRTVEPRCFQALLCPPRHSHRPAPESPKDKLTLPLSISFLPKAS